MLSSPENLKRLLRPTGPKIAVFLSVLVALFYAGSYSRQDPEQTLLGGLEGRALDVKFELRGPLEPSGNVVVVAIDERSVSELGRWPWPRGVMAELIEGLTAAGARVIALDMVFTDRMPGGRRELLRKVLALHREETAGSSLSPEPRSPSELERWILDELAAGGEDERLARAIFESGRVVWGLFSHSGPDSGPGEALSRQAYEMVRPFAVGRLFEERGGREVPDAVEVSDPSLVVLDLRSGIEAPLPVLAAAAPFFGFVNVDVDPDGVLRRSQLLARHEDVLIPSLALSAAAAWLGSRIHPMRDDVYDRRLSRVRLRVRSALSAGTLIRDDFGAAEWTERRHAGLEPGPWEAEHLERYRSWRRQAMEALGPKGDVDSVSIPGFLPDQRLDVPLDPMQGGRIMINHAGRGDAFDVVSAVDVISGSASAERLLGRLAVVGVTAVGTHDQRVTPFDANLPGVFVQASIMDAIISGRHLSRPWWAVPAELLALLLIGLVVGVLMPRLRGGAAVLSFVAGGLVLIGGAAMLLFSAFHVQIATFTPLATFLLLASTVAAFQWVVSDREKRHVRRAFQHYLAPSVLEAVLEDPKKLVLQPNKAELTVLFTDIRGFTGISERLSPEDLAKVLNEYLTPMTRAVFDHGGTLDKYMGDAVMAFWNDPIPQDDHALRACRAALEMQRVSAKLNESFSSRGWPKMEIGVGVNTGVMSVGNFGSDVLFDYTVMGDSVNLASRLEGTNKQYGTGIIISEPTHALVREEMVTRELDSVRVKGRGEPVRIFELLGEGEAAEEEASFLECFASALALYRSARFQEASRAFEICVEMRPADGPSLLYVERCKEMSALPPPEGWDGVYAMETK